MVITLAPMAEWRLYKIAHQQPSQSALLQRSADPDTLSFSMKWSFLYRPHSCERPRLRALAYPISGLSS